MNGELDGYRDGDIIQLLLDSKAVADIVDDWVETNQQVDMRVRRAKTKGCCVIETADLMFAARIVRYHPGTKANIKHARR
ncbi:MAG: RNA polymerase subunit sigma [Bacteroides sp.]|nr:RNA polymerase subunit sigma [Bacteroides sp.]